MGRVTARNNRPDPEELGVAISAVGVERPPNHRPSLRQVTPYPLDAYPFAVSAYDLRVLQREEAFRARELADLPDEGELW